MIINDEQLEKFRILYKNSFNEEISREDAYEQGMKLLRMMKAIYKPLPTEKKI